MTVIVHPASSTTFHNICEVAATKESTFKERVIADRIVMVTLLIATIIFAILIS